MYDVRKFEREELPSKEELESLVEISNDEKYQDFILGLNELNLKYLAGMMEMKTKIEIISEDLKNSSNYSPVKTIQTRLKSPESIIRKMSRLNLEPKIENINGRINDIAGVRIVCKYVPDIFMLVKLLKEDSSLKVLKEKNYVDNPKESGYRSYHLIVEVPVKLVSGIESVVVEIQIRTMSMDFWASIEHEIIYKYKGNIPSDVKTQMVEASDEAMALDLKMEKLKKMVLNSNE